MTRVNGLTSPLYASSKSLSPTTCISATLDRVYSNVRREGHGLSRNIDGSGYYTSNPRQRRDRQGALGYNDYNLIN